MEAPPRGPYVQAALFCDYFLVERDGTTSLIRVIDRITFQRQGPDAPEHMPPSQRAVQMVIMLKPGEARGRHPVDIWIESPDGMRSQVGSASATFDGGPNHGVNLPIRLQMEFRQEGLYWFDVIVEGTLLSRIPLAVQYQRIT